MEEDTDEFLDEELEEWDEEEEFYECDFGLPFNCDPECPYWGGDSICLLAMESYKREEEEKKRKKEERGD